MTRNVLILGLLEISVVMGLLFIHFAAYLVKFVEIKNLRLFNVQLCYNDYAIVNDYDDYAITKYF